MLAGGSGRLQHGRVGRPPSRCRQFLDAQKDPVYVRVLYVETTLSPGSTSRPLDSKTGTPFLRLKSARADPEWPTTTPCPSTRSRARGFESRALVFGDVLCTSMMELPPQRDWHSSATFGGGPPRPRGLSSGCRPPGHHLSQRHGRHGSSCGAPDPQRPRASHPRGRAALNRARGARGGAAGGLIVMQPDDQLVRYPRARRVGRGRHLGHSAAHGAIPAGRA